MFDVRNEFLLVIDLEATCNDAPAFRPREMEIIEIGAVLLERASMRPIDEFQTFVQPVVHPVLTRFCTALTTITQDDVREAPRFPAAIDALRKFIGDRDALFCSWGDYDRKQFELDAERHRCKLPFRGLHFNVKKAFSERRGESKRYGMGQALQLLGLPLEGTHHRGIDDARNIARIVPYLLQPAIEMPSF